MYTPPHPPILLFIDEVLSEKRLNEIGGNIPDGNFLGGNFLGGNFPGEGGIFQVGGSLMDGNFPGGNFPGGGDIFLEPESMNIDIWVLVH